MVGRGVVEAGLEAGIWAATHHTTQPWRYTVLAGDDALQRYLDTVQVGGAALILLHHTTIYILGSWQAWYDSHGSELPEREVMRANNKLANAQVGLLTDIFLNQ